MSFLEWRQVSGFLVVVMRLSLLSCFYSALQIICVDSLWLEKFCSCVLVRLSNSLFAVLEFIPAVGVFLKARIARYGSNSLSFAFHRMFSAVLPADSSCPLACRWPGLLVRCSNPHLSVNNANSEGVNRGPLSEGRYARVTVSAMYI